MDEVHRKHKERFDADPDAVAAFELLEEHLFMNQAWEDLAGLYRQRLEAPSLADEPRLRAQLQLRLAQLLEERCADGNGALAAYSESARLEPGQRGALQGLRRIYTTRESWEMVLQIAELELGAASDLEERAQLYSGMAEIWGSQLGDAAQADHYRGLARAELGFEDAPASQQASAAAPQVAAAAEPVATASAAGSADADDFPEWQPAEDEASPAANAPAQTNETDPRPDVSPADDEDDVEALVQRAWLVAARGDSEAALRDLRCALEREPGHIDAIDMMVTVLEGAERHAETAELLERRAEVASEGETRAAVLTRLGSVREEQLGDLGGARFAYERALAADSSNSAARSSLIRILRLIDDWSALRGLLEAQQASLPLGPRIEVLCELAALLEEQFDDPEAAFSTWQQILELEPDEPRAASALARIGAGADQSADPASDSGSADVVADDGASSGELRSVRLVGVLERKLEARVAQGTHLDPDGLALLLRIAELRTDTLDDLTGAIDVLESALEDEGALLEIAPRLAALYERVDRHADLADVAERAAACVGDPDQSAEWYRRAAETARTCGDTGRAVRCYGKLLAERPRDRDAEAALLDLHRARGEAEPLVRLLRVQLARTEASDETPLHVELASLLEGPLGDPAGAMSHLRRVLEIDTTHLDLLEQALRSADAVGGAFAQLDLLDHLRDAATLAPASRARVLARRGDLLADTIGWSQEAEESWRASLALDPEQSRVRDRLAQPSP